MSGSGRKKSTAGSPVGTNWNQTQLEVMLHAFQMPPWNQFLLYLCKGGAWNKSEIITAPWPCSQDSLELQCPWGAGVFQSLEDLRVPWIIGKHCAYKCLPERQLLVFIKISMIMYKSKRIQNCYSISHLLYHVPYEEPDAQRAKVAFPMQIKATIRYRLIPVRKAIIQKIRGNKSWCGCGERWTLVLLVRL